MKIQPEEIKKLLEQASKFKNFEVTEEDIKRFLSLLQDNEPIDLWDFTKKSSQYIRVILSLLYSLEKDKFLDVSETGEISLTPSGVGLTRDLSIKKNVHPFTKINHWCGLKLNPKFRRILAIIKELYKDVIPQNQYDQAPLVPEATVYKAAYAIERGDITGKEVVCIGDDDLTSIIFALGGKPKRILAVDIDKYLLETIEEYAEKHKLQIEILEHDLRKPIPEKFRGKFDTFISEPPDTVSGISLFVSRGTEFLKPTAGAVGYCGISLTACPPLGLFEMQKNFTNMNLLITDRIPKYSDYPPHRTELKHVEVPDCYDNFYPPKKVWYVSDLLRLATTKVASPLFTEYSGELANYKDDAIQFQ